MIQPGCVIIGAGGHARMVVEIFRAMGLGTPQAVLDADSSRWGGELDGVPIVGGDDCLGELALKGARCFVVGVGATADNARRRRVFEMGLAAGLQPLLLQHPTAIVSPRAAIAAGTQVFPGAIVNAGSLIGANVIVNSGAIVEHDCIIEDHAHVATGAVLTGTVSVGCGAHIGAGAVVRQRLRVGEWAVVGAGAVVIRDVAPRVVVVGVPARVMHAPNLEAAGEFPVR
jgi:sugar O-acyltransferase (sialic acid O-acetyltransferase NeuD family)